MLRRVYVTTTVYQGIAAVATLAALRWLATYVDPETLGRYSLYQSVIVAGTLFLVSWPNAALLRFGREEWTRDGRLGTTLGARTALFAVCVAIAIAAAWVADPWLRRFLGVDRSPFPWIAAGLLVTPAAELAIYLSQAIGRTVVYGYSPAIVRIGFFVGVCLIPLFGRRAGWTYLAAWLIASTAAATLFTLATTPRAAWEGFAIDRPMLARLLRYSWMLPFGAVSTYVVNWIDAWVIRNVSGLAAVGVYSWAYQTTAIASLVFAPMAVALTPRVIDARLNDDRARLERYTGSILPAALVCAAAVAASFVLVFPAIRALTSPAYAEAYPVVLVLLAALPFQLTAHLVTPLASAYERLIPRFVMVSVLIAVVNVAGDLLLVRRFGIIGAAIATAAAFAAGALVLVTVVRAEGLAFAPLWHYAAPGLVVFPAVALMYFAGPFVGSAVIVATGAIALAIGAFSRKRRARTTARAWPFSALAALGMALTLDDEAHGGSAEGVRYPAAPRAIES